MGKKIFSIVLLAVVFCISFSCKEGKSLQERLKEETRAIDRFIKMNDFKILDEEDEEFPKGKWPENTFFRTRDGLFFQVVDSGNGKRAKLLDEISVRYEYFQLVKDAATGDTLKYSFPYFSSYNPNNPPPLGHPFYFTYGLPQTYSSSSSPMCQAWVIPLSYVGEGAILNMIVPSSVGASYDYSNITPVFYKNLRYTRFN